MNVCLLSAFANAVGYLPRYLNQVTALRAALYDRGHTLRCLWAEGDSSDVTRDWLDKVATFHNAIVVSADHGGTVYGSVVDERRFRQLTQIWNKLLDRLRDDFPCQDDVVLLVESDLIWQAASLVTLVEQTRDYPVVCGMVWLGGPGVCFYDVWAYRKGGRQFINQPPFHSDLSKNEMVQLDSAGSCLAVRGDIARVCRPTEQEALIGFCRQVYERGGSVWLNPNVDILHP